MSLRIPVFDDIIIKINTYVVTIDIPLLLGLEVLRELNLFINFGDGVMMSSLDDWRMNLTFKMGHLYAEWPPSVYYTETELRRIHHYFYHPSTEELLGIIQHGAKEHAIPDLRSQLEHILEICDTCQRLAKETSRFRVTMPNTDCVFNRTVGMGIMKLEGHSVLHIVDHDTKFSAASYLERVSTAIVLKTVFSGWVATYIGYPTKVILDQRPQFQSHEYYSSLAAAGVKQGNAEAESHNALGGTERYHSYLRNVFAKVRSEHLELLKNIILQIAVKA